MSSVGCRIGEAFGGVKVMERSICVSEDDHASSIEPTLSNANLAYLVIEGKGGVSS